MANGEVAERLKSIEDRLDKLDMGGAGARAGRKDGWDKAQIAAQLAASLLLPVALAAAGFHFSGALADAQIASEERREKASITIAESSVRVSQAELVATFMRSLLSADAPERELAIRAVLIALPEWGPQLVEAIGAASRDPQTRAVAAAAINERREELVEEVYAGDEAVQQEAASRLVAGFRQDPKLIDAIARGAERHGDAGGASSATVVLQALPADKLQAKEAAVRKVTELAKQGDARAVERAAQIDQKLRKP